MSVIYCIVMSLNSIIEAQNFLPVSPKGLQNVLEDLTIDRTVYYDMFEYLDVMRYAVRTIGALLPVDKFTVEYLAKTCSISYRLYSTELLEVLLCNDMYAGECSVLMLRTFLGLVDDGVKPSTAADYIGLTARELQLLENYLYVSEHWEARIKDITETMVAYDATSAQIARRIGCSRMHAYRLRKRTMRQFRRAKRLLGAS